MNEITTVNTEGLKRSAGSMRDLGRQQLRTSMEIQDGSPKRAHSTLRQNGVFASGATPLWRYGNSTTCPTCVR